jgi:type I restriction enzyme M protein
LLGKNVVLKDALATFTADVAAYEKVANEYAKRPIKADADNATLHKASEALIPLAEQSRDLIKNADYFYKLAGHAVDALDGEAKGREINRARRDTDEARRLVVEALKPVRYFHRQALWLQERFPDAQLRDVPGLVKLVSRADIEANDWSLTPGRYVGVAPEDVDADFDFEAALKDIHIELKGLNDEAVELAATIALNFEELGA